MTRVVRLISVLTLTAAGVLFSAGAASPVTTTPSHDGTFAAASPGVTRAVAAALPAARPGNGCLPQFYYCVIFSPDETETVASGAYTATVAVLAAGCGFIPSPGSVACAGGAALYGPVTSEAAKGAARNGLCLGLTSSTTPTTNPLPMPVQAIC